MVNNQPGRPNYGSPYVFPSLSGTYALAMRLAHPLTLEVGRLGTHRLPSAIYLYTGSACGPGGLRARIERHLRLQKPHHWHIDFLRPQVDILCVYYSTTPQRLECAWSKALTQLPGAFIPVARFGASDCASGCPAHLIALPLGTDLSFIAAALSFPECVNMRK